MNAISTPHPEQNASPNAGPRQRKARHFHRSGRVVSITGLRITALAALVAFGFFFVQLMLTRNPELGYYALATLGAFIALRFTAFIKAQSVTCQLCHGTVLQANTCHKHRDAHRIPLLGYFWTAAFDVVTKGCFRCMYCGTAYRLKK